MWHPYVTLDMNIILYTYMYAYVSDFSDSLIEIHTFSFTKTYQKYCLQIGDHFIVFKVACVKQCWCNFPGMTNSDWQGLMWAHKMAKCDISYILLFMPYLNYAVLTVLNYSRNVLWEFLLKACLVPCWTNQYSKFTLKKTIFLILMHSKHFMSGRRLYPSNWTCAHRLNKWPQ